MSPQKDTQEKPQADPQAESQAEPQSAPTEPYASVPSAGVMWVRISPNQVIRTVVVALLSAAVGLGAFFLLWKVRTFVGWFVISLFLAAVARAPGGPTKSLRGPPRQYGLGWVFERFSDQIDDIRSQLGRAASNF